MLILLVIVIGILGVNTSSFVALFASAGIAVGMALSGTLQNFAGGVMVLLFKPYKVGDYIEAQGQSGTVKEIQIFNTILNTPNRIKSLYQTEDCQQVLSIIIRKKVSAGWIGLSVSDMVIMTTKLKKYYLECSMKIHEFLKILGYFIALHSLGDSSVNIVVRAWVATSDYWSVFRYERESIRNLGNTGSIYHSRKWMCML